jgi:hypothetical protein
MENTKFSKNNRLDKLEAKVQKISLSNFLITDTRKVTMQMNSKMKKMKNIKQDVKIQKIELE